MGKPVWVRRLGRAVETMMRDEGWSQDDLARRASNTGKTISNLINGKVTPRPKTVIAVMAAFGQKGADKLREFGLDGWAATVERELEQRHDNAMEAFMATYGDDLRRRIADET